MAIFYEWYCIETCEGFRARRRRLRWRMTQDQAISWGQHPDNHAKVLELVPGSGEDRGESTGYVGWGQALPGDEGQIEAKTMGDRWKPKR